MTKKLILCFGILLFSCSFFTACTEDKDPVRAIVNGVEIKKSQAQNEESLENEIQKTVIQTESKRLKLSEKELFELFDMLKTRKIPKEELEKFVKAELKDKEVKPQTRDEIVGLLREQQFEAAKKRYISELKDRSTIWVIQDGQKMKYEPIQK
jgi:hypothetical protein